MLRSVTFPTDGGLPCPSLVPHWGSTLRIVSQGGGVQVHFCADGASPTSGAEQDKTSRNRSHAQTPTLMARLETLSGNAGGLSLAAERSDAPSDPESVPLYLILLTNFRTVNPVTPHNHPRP